MPNYPYPKIIATFCFLVVLCQVGSSLKHTKSWTELEYRKVHLSKYSHFMILGAGALTPPPNDKMAIFV